MKQEQEIQTQKTFGMYVCVLLCFCSQEGKVKPSLVANQRRREGKMDKEDKRTQNIEKKQGRICKRLKREV